MGRNTLRWTAGGLAVTLILLSATAFQVREGHTALVTRFGRPVREVASPGLHWKLFWPVDRATTLDLRSRVFNTRHSEVLTRDKKNVILLSYAVWHVAEPWTFYRAVGTLEAADAKLEGLVIDAKANVLGRHDLAALVSTDPELLAVDEIEDELLASVRDTARSSYGIAIDHVGFKRLSLPEENVTAVFNQMRAERQKNAATFRAEGDRQAATIRAETDLAVAEVIATATEEAARTRGEAEAQAARIYADAHRLDPEFYRFVRQLEGLERMLGERATVILRTDSAPFGLLKDAGLDAAGDDEPDEPDEPRKDEE